MTKKQLMNMQQLLKAAEIDCDCLSIEEIEDLRLTVESELYTQRIKDFKQYLDKAMPEADASKNTIDNFYKTDWHISFGNRSVVIHNEATVYNYVTGMLKELID